jgi:hypothetical protein
MVPQDNGNPEVDKSRAWKVRTSNGDQFLHFGEEMGPKKRRHEGEEADETGQQERDANYFNLYDL